MGMQHHEGPERRNEGTPACKKSFRISHIADHLVEALRKPDVLTPNGCSKGDVIELSLREMEGRFDDLLKRGLPFDAEFQSSIEMSRAGVDRWNQLAESLGVSQTAIIEMALRLTAVAKLAKAETDRIVKADA